MIEKLLVLTFDKTVLLPYQELKYEVQTKKDKDIIDNSIEKNNSKILITLPENDMNEVMMLAKIKSKIELPNGNYRLMITGLNRVTVKEHLNESECIVKRLYIFEDETSEDIATIRTLKTNIENYMEINPNVSNSVASTIKKINDLDTLTDIITTFMPFEFEKKLKYMFEMNFRKRAIYLNKDISMELEVVTIESKVEDEIRESLNKEQRDYLLKQKIQKLNEELGIEFDKHNEIFEYEEKVKSINIDDKTRSKLLNEVKKFSYTSESSPDFNGIRNYLDTVISLPWNNSSEDEMNLTSIKNSLDESHYGLDEIKQRILEYIAVKKNNLDAASPILCLVGPPGTGKTTIGISIAHALKREFYKISVGGINDPSEFVGHKRTYLGASPGKIIQAIKKCGTNNPVILLDEIDKMSSSGYLGDPSAILLDILDNTQNSSFVDNYIEEPFNLSKVLFILTANDLKSISPILRDRLEIIEINSYTEIEKIDIAKKYLISKIITDYHTSKLTISNTEIKHIINSYTKEAGVRDLDRCLKKIFRNIIINNIKTKTITKEIINDSLGVVKYGNQFSKKKHEGSVCALGVTPYGGVIINIESILIPGSGDVIVTGNVETAIKETTNIAYHYIISKMKEFNIDPQLVKNNDIHINLLNYAIKKTGTSGTLAITTSMLSLLLNKEVDDTVCFTGEVTLHGDICKVNGIKEKIIGAYNNDFKTIFIPEDNKNDLETVPNDIKEKLEIKCVSNYSEIFEYLFKKHK